MIKPKIDPAGRGRVRIALQMGAGLLAFTAAAGLLLGVMWLVGRP